MSGGRTSAKDLFAAARGDGPSAASRDAMWRSVEAAALPAAGAGGAGGAGAASGTTTTAGSAGSGVGAGAGAGTGAAPAATTAAIAAKASFLGAVVGSTVSMAIAVVAFHALRPAPTLSNDGDAPVARVERAGDVAPDFRPPAMLAEQGSPPAPASSPGGRTHDDARTGTAATSHAASSAGGGAVPADSASFAREVALVGAAREALLRRDAAACLEALRAARALRSRQLEPEELGLEARALRMQGEFEQAARVEATLRAKYPRAISNER